MIVHGSKFGRISTFSLSSLCLQIYLDDLCLRKYLSYWDNIPVNIPYKQGATHFFYNLQSVQVIKFVENITHSTTTDCLDMQA